jgi:hypothetical protein
VARKKTVETLVLVGRDKPRLREATKRDLTKKKEAEFLSALADTCNVTHAAKQAGVSPSGVYKRRKENAAFRAGWLEAISVAYQRLELVLLDRAFNGTEKVVTRRDGSEERMSVQREPGRCSVAQRGTCRTRPLRRRLVEPLWIPRRAGLSIKC